MKSHQATEGSYAMSGEGNSLGNGLKAAWDRVPTFYRNMLLGAIPGTLGAVAIAAGVSGGGEIQFFDGLVAVGAVAAAAAETSIRFAVAAAGLYTVIRVLCPVEDRAVHTQARDAVSTPASPRLR